MKPESDPWSRLARTARQSPEPAAAEAPFGFATRVVAQWQTAPAPSLASVWETLSKRILAVSCALMVITVVASYGLIQESVADTWTTTSGAMEIDLP